MSEEGLLQHAILTGEGGDEARMEGARGVFAAAAAGQAGGGQDRAGCGGRNAWLLGAWETLGQPSNFSTILPASHLFMGCPQHLAWPRL